MPPGSNQLAVVPRVLAHYASCAALLDASFAGSPIVFVDFPRGFHAPPRFRVTQMTLSAARIDWLVQREYAIEFHSWAPLPGEPERLRFGRILLEPPRGQRAFAHMKEAALVMREQLRAAECDAVPLLDGTGGIVLWLPFIEAPLATKVRARLQRLCARAAALYPRLLCSGALPSEKCVRLDASTNAPGQYSPLPYSLRGTPALPVCTPVTWEELETLRAPVVCTAESWPARLSAQGDLFAQGVAKLAQQRLRAWRADSSESAL